MLQRIKPKSAVKAFWVMDTVSTFLLRLKVRPILFSRDCQISVVWTVYPDFSQLGLHLSQEKRQSLDLAQCEHGLDKL